MASYKKDAVLIEAVDAARSALDDIAAANQVGEYLSATTEGERLVTHRFAAQKPGYHGWEWFVTVARAPRSKKVTVCELGLLPGEEALVAPEWIPWSERLSDAERDSDEAITSGQNPTGA